MMTEQGTDQGEKCGTRGSVGMGMHPAQRTRSGAKSTVADVPVLISVGLNVLVRTRQSTDAASLHLSLPLVFYSITFY